MTPLVTETVTGTLIAFTPSEIAMLVEPLPLVPMPIEVSTNVPVDAGEADADTATDAGETVTIVVSALTAVNVPLKPFSLTLIFWLPLTPPNATLVGLATGVGVGVGIGVGVGVGVGLAVGVAVATGVAVGPDEAEVLGVVPPPPPPQATSQAHAAVPSRIAMDRVTFQSFG